MGHESKHPNQEADESGNPNKNFPAASHGLMNTRGGKVQWQMESIFATKVIGVPRFKSQSNAVPAGGPCPLDEVTSVLQARYGKTMTT